MLRSYSEMSSHTNNTLCYDLPAEVWGVIIFGTGPENLGISPELAARIATCSKLIYDVISNNDSQSYWERHVLERFESFKSDYEFRVGAIWRALFASYSNELKLLRIASTELIQSRSDFAEKIENHCEQIIDNADRDSIEISELLELWKPLTHHFGWMVQNYHLSCYYASKKEGIVNPDAHEAEFHFNISLNDGFHRALYDKAMSYRARRMDIDAIYYFERAAKKGNIDALQLLGNCYSNKDKSICIFVTLKEASRYRELYEKHPKFGFKPQENLIPGYRIIMNPEKQRNQRAVRNNLIQIAEAGDVDACNYLHRYYSSKRDPREAFKFARLAADNGSLRAQCIVTQCFEEVGNEEEALKYSKLHEQNVDNYCLEALSQNDSGTPLTPQAINFYNSRKVMIESRNVYIEKIADCFHKELTTCDSKVDPQSSFLNSIEKYLLDDHSNSKAQYCLALCYRNGIDTEIDLDKAFKFMTLSANQGHSDGQCHLGTFYEYGIGTETNLYKAFECYELSANQGNASAQYNLGVCYQEGTGTTIDLKKAFELVTFSANQGNASAQCRLGLYYEEGIGTEIKLGSAFEYYRLSANQGNASAQCCLGAFYKDGIGTEINLKKAFEFMTLSANQGDVDAQYCLGAFYEDGIGTEINLEGAFEFMTLSADQGDADAQRTLGLYYEDGTGTEINLEKAFEFMTLSANQGNASAQCRLGLYYEEGIGIEINLEKAFEFMTLSANQGDADAQRLLGLYYEDGIGTEINLRDAFEFTTLSANQGHAHAQCMLGYYYEGGVGTDINLGSAFRYYTLSADQGFVLALNAITRLKEHQNQ